MPNNKDKANNSPQGGADDNSEQTEITSITPARNTEDATPNSSNITAHFDHVDNVNVFRTFLDYLPHAIIGLVGVIALVAICLVLFGNGNFGINLSSFDQTSARALITVLVAVVTIAIAVILTLSAFFSQANDFKERFTMGKEILTILIGVLGTIVGFYFGSAGFDNKATNGPGLEILPPKPFTSQINGKENIVFSTFIKGGTPPYEYLIYFYPSEIASPVKGSSQNGIIQESLEVTAALNKEAVYHIRVTDKDKSSALLSNSMKDFPIKETQAELDNKNASVRDGQISAAEKQVTANIK